MSALVWHVPELNFTVVADVYEYHVDFTIYDIAAWVQSTKVGEFDTPEWPERGTAFGGQTVAELEKAEVYLHGSVKWDGCSNWHFDEQDRAMLHGCHRKDLTRYGEILAACWDWTAETLPSWRI